MVCVRLSGYVELNVLSCIIFIYVHDMSGQSWTCTHMVYQDKTKNPLVGGLEHFLFFHMLGISSSSQLTHIVQRGRSTTNQIYQVWDPSET